MRFDGRTSRLNSLVYELVLGAAMFSFSLQFTVTRVFAVIAYDRNVQFMSQIWFVHMHHIVKISKKIRYSLMAAVRHVA